jgi:adenylate cyclase
MAARSNRSKALISVAITLGVWFGSWFIVSTPPIRTLELNVLDLLYEFRGQNDVSDSPIVLVAISEQSALEFDEKWPWPTHLYARLIRNLNRAGAKVIAIDVIFDKSDIYDPANDTLFANALAEAGNVVLAGNLLTESQRAFDQVGTIRVESKQLVQPIPMLRDANPNPWGYVEVERDRDGFLRRYGSIKTHLDETILPLGMEALRIALNIPRDSIIDLEREIRFGDRVIPKYSPTTFMINFNGPRSTFPEFNFSDVVDDSEYFTSSEDEFFEVNAFDDPDFGLLHQDVFRDKIVIVGATMPELQDFYATPYAANGNMPGYETHANAMQTILNGNAYQRVNNNILLIASLITTALLVIITLFVSAKWALVYLVVFLTTLFVGVFVGFMDYLWVLEITPFFTPAVFAYVGSVTYTYIAEQREKSRIRNLFGTYVSPELVTRMVESAEEPKLGGDSSVITAFFSDIQNFSTFSEQMPPDRLVNLMNEYLSAMTDIVLEEGGMLDKYIGDAIVAFWGAPIAIPNHAEKAARASQRIMLKQAELRKKWASEPGWPVIVHSMQTRIGLNSGVAITGNMGSAKRFNYTMMGDTVNLAARCESGAKSYGVYTMVTDETRSMVTEHTSDLVFRTLDRIVVKGRSQPVTVFEILGFQDQVTRARKESIALFEEGLVAYWNQHWDEAIRLFTASEAGEEHPDLNPSMIMLARAKVLKFSPPDAGWDGVYVMRSK